MLLVIQAAPLSFLVVPMRPLLPKEFLRKFPKRSVIAGVQRQCATIAKQPGVIAMAVSLGLHGSLALSLPRLLPSAAQDDTAAAIETDVVSLSPTDLAAFSAMATAPPQRLSNRRYTDLNGQTLPNLSALRSPDKKPSSSGMSSFGWGSASSYYDWSDRGSSSSSGSSDTKTDSSSSSSYETYDATREDEFYEYWQRSQDLLDRFDQGGGSGGRGNGAGNGTGNNNTGEGETDGDGDTGDKKAIAGNGGNTGGGSGGNTGETGAGGGGTGEGFNSGAPYTTGMAARQSYAVWAIAMQDENRLSDADLTPIFIPVSIPVPVTAGSSRLIGEQGVVGLLVKPDGTPASADLLSSFSSNEMAKNLVREFVLAGFEGCNVGIPSDTWTACGLDITFVAATGGDRNTDPTGDNASNGGNSTGNTGTTDGNAGNSGTSGNSGNSSNAGNSGGTNSNTTTPTPGVELPTLIAEFEPDTPIAIALTEATPAYDTWRQQLTSRLGRTAAGLVFRAVPSTLPYPAELDPAFDRTQPTTAIVSLALSPDLSVIPETATVLRSSGNDQLDAIALRFAETTPRDWYATNLDLSGEQGAIVLFPLSFEESADDAKSPGTTSPDDLETDNTDNPDSETSEATPNGTSSEGETAPSP